MKKNMNIEYIRAFAMLGVIGIHTGAYSLNNPHINMSLFALLEIASRFSIPGFFFMSAFGLFWKFAEKKDSFSYPAFLKRRATTVIMPYTVWSLLYLAYYSYSNKDLSVWSIPYIIKTLFFGLASYQLYFMVILIWFYLLMPFWRIVVPFTARHLKTFLPLIFLLQVLFNYYLSYEFRPHFQNELLKFMWEYKLNYFIFYYIFIFILGGVCSLKYETIINFLQKHKLGVTAIYIVSTMFMLGTYYYFVLVKKYSLLEAVFTLHQHSPPGVFYASASMIFGLMFFSCCPISKSMTRILNTLSKQSYFIYLFHPFAMYFLIKVMEKNNLLFTSLNTIFFFLAALIISSIAAFVLDGISKYLPFARQLLLGSAKTK